MVNFINKKNNVITTKEFKDAKIGFYYINKDYPKNGDITYTNTNYYAIKYDLVPNIEMQNLTEEEKKKILN